MKNSIIFLVKIFSKVFTYKLFKKINLYYTHFYTIWIKEAFKSVGRNTFIAYPIYLHGGKYITIGNNFNSGLRLRLEAFDEHLGHCFSPRIIIGDNVSINSDCHIGAINKIIIGNGVLMASKIFITDHFHGEITSEAIRQTPSERKLYSKGSVIIEDNVWIGESVTILPGVTVGENSIIGSNSVVSKNIPKNSIAAGNPVKIIKSL